MDRFRPWLDAAKPDQALLPPFAVAVGVAYAHFDSQPSRGFASLLLVWLAAFAAGVGVNLVDHAWDRLGAPPSGPVDAPEDAYRPAGAGESAILGAAASLLAGLLALASQSGSAVLVYGGLAVALGVVRGAPGLGLDTLGFGLGDLANILALGPLAAMAGFASQAGEGSWGAFLAGLPVGLLAAAALFARHFTRRASDAGLRRMTPVAMLGEQQARLLLIALPLFAVAAVVLVARAGEYPWWAQSAALAAIAAAAAAWRLPTEADPDAYSRWGRLAVGCALAASAIVALALRFSHPA